MKKFIRSQCFRFYSSRKREKLNFIVDVSDSKPRIFKQNSTSFRFFNKENVGVSEKEKNSLGVITQSPKVLGIPESICFSTLKKNDSFKTERGWNIDGVIGTTRKDFMVFDKLNSLWVGFGEFVSPEIVSYGTLVLPGSLQSGVYETSCLTRRWENSVRSVLKNGFLGAWLGFMVHLHLVGTGYSMKIWRSERFQDSEYSKGLKGDSGDLLLEFRLGFNRNKHILISQYIGAFSKKKNHLCLYGADLMLVAQTLAKIRELRKPDPYKGKGFRYRDEIVKVKVGKKK